MYNPYDHYFNKAKKDGYSARSVFKLEEIDKKFHIFDGSVKKVLDIWCAPGSWLQYVSKATKSWSDKMTKWLNIKKDIWANKVIIGLDIKEVKLNFPWVYTYKQDISDQEWILHIFDKHKIDKFDCIISDMAPNTIWVKDIDAIRSFDLIEKSLWIYEKYLNKNWRFVTKLFMWPGFDEYVKKMKDMFGWRNIKIFKPDASRKNSKETYVIKVG